MPPASTFVVKPKSKDSKLPGVNDDAKMFRKALSTSDTPVLRSPLTPPVDSTVSTLPALPPTPNRKLLSVTVLLASPVALPSVNMNASSNDPERAEVSRLTDPVMRPACAGR